MDDDQEAHIPWLLDCYHRHGLVDRPAPLGIETLFADVHPWLADATGDEIDLDYEPRSLAINRDADRVAVGTKSGKVYLAARTGSTWSTTVVQLKAAKDSATRAVRGLAFGATGRLYACAGSGRAWLVEEQQEPRLIKLSDDEAPSLRGWVGRCQRLLPLTPSYPTAGADDNDDFLVLTRGDAVCRLRVDDLRIVDVGQGHEALFPGWPGERITAGAWTGEFLWVLGDQGALHLFRFGSPQFVPLAQYRLHYPRGRGLFADISPTPIGLGVLAADDLTFLPFETSRRLPEGPRLRLSDNDRVRAVETIPEVNPRTWRHVEGAMDVAAWLPFYGSQADLDDAREVTIFVAQAHRGLSSASWDVDSEEPPELSSVPLSEHRDASSALFVAVRTTAGGETRPSGKGPAVLAISTRDHRLILRSLLDRRILEPTLAEHWKAPASIRTTGEPLPTHEAWWLASRELVTEDPRLEVLEACSPSLEAADVRRLAVTLMAKPLGEAGGASAANFKGWIRALLRRASELGTQAVNDTCAEIAQGLARQAPQGDDWIKHYEGLFRKWVIYGYTYGDKELELRHLWQTNDESDRALDALTYLTKGIRKRADATWRVEVADPTLRSPAWDLRAAKDGALALVSFTDGTIAALGLDGSRYSFVADKLPSDLGVELDGAGRILSVGTREFRRKYHHGPYARRLYVEHLADHRYLAAFALRGWRREDLGLEGARKALLVALELELDKDHRQVSIRSCDSMPLDDEGYAIAERYVGPQSTYLLIGTAGEREAEAGHYSPFLQVELGTRGGVHIEPPKPLQFVLPAGERTRIPEALLHQMLLRDPCWSLVSDPRRKEGELWAGFQSGRIIKFAVKEGKVAGSEGAELLGDGAIWGLAATPSPISVRPPHPAGSRLGVFLAYGTARGVIGVVHATDETDQTQVAHVYQTRESGPISSIFAYSDEEQRFFLAATQGGIAVLLRVNGTAQTPPGSRVDRFSLPGTARAVVPIRASDDKQGPEFIVASGDGVLRRFCLAFPRGSARRRAAAVSTQPLLRRAAHDLGLLFGSDHTVDGLRLLRVGGEQLRRFSLWQTMQKAAADLLGVPPLPSDEPPVAPYEPPAADRLGEQVRRYSELMADLAEECFRLRPFRREPAKIVWEEGARVARALAAAALDHPDREDLVDAALHLHVEVDDLCNRWMGTAHGDEAAVLAHSFAHLVDWADIALLGRSKPEGAKQDEYRRVILTKLIARRLTHDSQIVPLEGLRIINDASWRVLVALAEARTKTEAGGSAGEGDALVNTELPADHWTHAFGHRSAAARAGLYELAILVGELGKKALPSARSGDPLISEVTRYFALALLLTPNRSGVLYQVFSESGLFGPPFTLRKEVKRLAERYRSWLDVLVPGGATSEMGQAIRLFDLASETSEELVKTSWDELEATVKDLPPEADDVFSDASFYGELVTVIKRAKGLWSVTEGEGQQPSPSTAAEPIRGRYFPHSGRYLNDVDASRGRIREILGDPRAFPTNQQLRAWQKEYAPLVRKLAEADLFEPQKSQYARIVRNWKSEIENRGWAGLELLETLDRMNRHVFRRDADRLLEAVIEVASRATPLYPALLDGPHSRRGVVSLREHLLRELEARPLLRALYDQTQAIVETNSLTSALLVAGVTRIQGGKLGTVTGEQLYRAFRGSCEPHGIHVPEEAPEVLDYPPIPGNVLLWKSIFSELALNLRKYGTEEKRRQASMISERNEQSFSLVVAGNRPLLHTLPDPEQKQLQPCDDEEVRQKLSAKVKLALDDGSRLAVAGESSTGMGLFILQRMAKLLHATLDARLASGLAKAASFETIMQWPVAALTPEASP